MTNVKQTDDEAVGSAAESDGAKPGRAPITDVAPSETPAAPGGTKPQARKVGARRKRSGPRPMPALKVDVDFKTDFAKRVYNRTWDTIKGHLYTVTVTTLALGMDEAAQLYEKFIDEEMSKVEEDLASEIERADTAVRDAGITGYASYPAAEKFETEFTTPQARRYLNLILQLDQLVMRLDVLYLSGEIDTKACKSRSHEWQSRLIKVANRLREQAMTARRGMDRLETQRTEAREARSEGAATGDNGAESADSGEAEVVGEDTTVASDAEADAVAEDMPATVALAG